MPRKTRIDMVGLRFGRLLGLEFSHALGGHAHWLFQCDCGAKTIVSGSAVRSGKTGSCGCLHRQICAERLFKHGWRAAKRHDSTYRTWQEINDACGNPASPRFKDFGAIDIKVCPRWRSNFKSFLEDMGERPPDTILARINSRGDFKPSNCHWVQVRPRAQRAVDAWQDKIARQRLVRIVPDSQLIPG